MNPLAAAPTFIDLFKAMPGNSALLLPDAPRFTIVAVTDDYIKTSGQSMEELIGKGLFEAFPNAPDDPAQTGVKQLQASLEEVLCKREAHRLPLHRYDLLKTDGSFEERYWSSVNKPVLGEDGAICYILHCAEDLTQLVKAEQNEKAHRELEKRYQELLTAPVLLCILKGDDYLIASTNEQTLNVWGRSPEIIGKPLLQALPELAHQGFMEILEEVKQTGQPAKTYETPATILRDGQEQTLYLDFVFQPYFENGTDEAATGVICVAHDRTDQVVARKMAAESERNFRNLIEQSPVAMDIMRGPQFVFEIVNAKMLELLGKAEEEVVGKPLAEAFPEVIEQGFDQLLRHTYTTGERFEANEYPVVLNQQGAEKRLFLNFTYEPIRESNGSISGIVAVAVDVTEQVEARRKVEESIQEVHAIVDNAPFPIGVYAGREMRIRLANQSIIEVWGKGPDVIGKTYAELLPELKGSGIYEQLDSVYTTGVPFHARNQQVDLVVEGRLQPFYFNYSLTPLYNTEGKIYGVMNTAAEITDLHHAKQQVEQSERNFRNMILQAPVAMCIMLGPEHIVDIANEAMIELWGKPREQVMNKPVFDALPEARNQGLEKVMQNVYETGVPFYANERPVALLRNGKLETVYQNFVYQPYQDAEGKRLGVLAISVDVTAQVLARQQIEDIVVQRTSELAVANQALVESNEELTRLNANLEEFAYAASHDLKEPLRKIHFFSDRLKGQLENQLSAEQKQFFDRMEHAAKRMTSLVDELLAYSQATRGLNEQEEVDLNRKVQLVLGDLELEVQQKGARITVGPLPTIQGSKRQMQQLFQNLITNALKYSKPNTPPEIQITAREVIGKEVRPDLPPGKCEQPYYLIEVSDNGIGFEQKDAQRIFNVFTRLHSGAEYRGTGVGLSIAQKVVQNHGGFIWTESTPGEGATFYVLLPVG